MSSANDQSSKLSGNTAGVTGQSAWRPSQEISIEQWDGRSLLFRSMQGNGSYHYAIMRRGDLYWEGTEPAMKQDDFEDYFWDHEFMEIPR